ncbi:MAG: glycosyltransferase family 4 protein [Gemmatimonadota bacterium]
MTEHPETRPRLLFLGDTLPYPPDRGAALSAYHVLRHLAARYDIDALLFRRRGDPTRTPLDARVAHLATLARVEHFPIPGERSVARARLDRLRSRLLRRTESYWRYDDRRYRRRLLELVFERDPRILHVDTIGLHAYLPALADRPVVLAHRRLESERLRRQAALVSGGGAEYLVRQADWMEEVERTWAPRVALNTVRSEADGKRLLERAPGARVRVMPPAVDTRHFTPSFGTGQGLAFVGGTTGAISRDALEYFTEEILPRLQRVSGVQALEPISWIGAAREGDRETYRRRGIDITGYVEDIRPIVRPAACYVVPRRTAGDGVRVLQAWAMGKAVVSTSPGCQGLEVEDGRNILVRDDPAAFARAVLDVLEDRELRRRLGEAGRKTVEERYSWEQRGRELIDLYRDVERADGDPGGSISS